jgi:hypothetical protein
MGADLDDLDLDKLPVHAKNKLAQLQVFIFV